MIRLIYIIVFAIAIVFIALINDNVEVPVTLIFGKTWHLQLRLALILFVLIGVLGTLVGGLIDHFQLSRKNKALRNQLAAQTEELAALREMVTMDQSRE